MTGTRQGGWLARTRAVFLAAIGWLAVLGLLVAPGQVQATQNEAPAAAVRELTRKVKDIYGTHNVVYVNYDSTNNRLRAHCVSVGNGGVNKYIKSCRLYEDATGRYVTGRGIGPSKSNIRTYSGLMGNTRGCYFARMWVVFPGTNNGGFTITTPCRRP